MLSIQVRQTGMGPIRVGLSRLEGAIRDLRPAWDQVVPYLDAVETKAFSSEGASTQGGKWRPLTARYRRWKERAFPGRTILELTGRLRESVVGSTPDTVAERTATRLVYGTRVPYAHVHQRTRPFLHLTNRQTAEIGSIVARYLRREAAKGFASRSGVGI